MARIRAQEQEEANRARAKLGLPPVPITPAPSAAPDSDSTDSKSSSSSDEDNDGNRPSTSGRNAANDGGIKFRGKRKVKATADGEKKKMKDKHGKARMMEGKEEDNTNGGSAAAAVNGSGAPDSATPMKAASKRVVVVVGNDAAIAARLRMFASFQPTSATGWWGAKMFVSAGLLESLEDEAASDQRLADEAQRLAADQAAGRVALAGTAAVAAGQRRGFNEDDQTALFKRAHDFQRMGRRGLGKAEIKVGGAKWEGTKKTFGDEEEDEDEEGPERRGGKEEPKAEAAVDYEGNGASDEEPQTKKSKKKKKEKGKADRDPAVHEELIPIEKAEKKAKKERRRQQEQEQQVELDAAAAVVGAVKNSKKRRCDNGTAAMAAGKAGDLQDTKQQDDVAVNQKPADHVSIVESGAATAAAPKPKWLKLARMVLKKSVERRVKLRKVIAELLQHAEEQHRQHRHQHKHSHLPKESGKNSANARLVEVEGGAAGSCDTNGSPWDHDSVREALERKIRKNNSGLAIDGKFLTMVSAS
ncbi:hypothetical protein Vafri_15099 [Volvox africanus]|nr:hypothetical protein Vafri_15099 [Volvox africanus]